MDNNFDSVFDNSVNDDLEFDVVFDQEDSLIDTVNGVNESGDPLTGEDCPEASGCDDDEDAIVSDVVDGAAVETPAVEVEEDTDVESEPAPAEGTEIKEDEPANIEGTDEPAPAAEEKVQEEESDIDAVLSDDTDDNDDDIVSDVADDTAVEGCCKNESTDIDNILGEDADIDAVLADDPEEDQAEIDIVNKDEKSSGLDYGMDDEELIDIVMGN